MVMFKMKGVYKQIIIFYITTILPTSLCFYLPGLAPVSFCKVNEETDKCKSEIMIYVNRLHSINNVIPYEYSSFDLCHDPNGTYDANPSENLGQVVFGDRIRPSAYKFKLGQDMECQKVCTKKYSKSNAEDMKNLEFIKKGISENYQHHWIVDNMPVTWCYEVADSIQKYCSTGFPIGCYVTETGQPKDACVISNQFYAPDTYYVFNHVDITITYHDGLGEQWTGARLLSAKIEPRSIDHQKGSKGKDVSCSSIAAKGISGKKTEDVEITYTYSVKFKKNNVWKWASRWDYILESMPHTRIHQFSVFHNMIMVLVLSFALFWPIRKIKTDINNIKSAECEKDFYLLVIMHNGDLFRSPNLKLLLSVFVGTGIQVFTTCFVTLLFGAAGFLSPANRGALATCALLLYICFGFIGGFTCAQIYKITLGNKWFETAIIQSVFLPGMTVCVVLLLNIIHIINHSSAALPYDTTLIVVGLWLGLHVPFTLLGAYLGFKRKSHIAKVSEKPREIPCQKLYVRPLASFILSGILPFGSIFVQLFFTLNSIWSGQIYYMFGWLLLTFCIFSMISMQTTVYMSAFHIRAQDYRWWWRSFITSASSGFYMFLYMIHFYITKLTYNDFATAVLYFGYSLLIAFVFSIMSGSIGFLAALYFVKKIHRASKNAFVMSQIGDKISFNSLLDNPDVSLSGNQDINDGDELKVQIKGNTNDEFYFDEQSCS